MRLFTYQLSRALRAAPGAVLTLSVAPRVARPRGSVAAAPMVYPEIVAVRPLDPQQAKIFEGLAIVYSQWRTSKLPKESLDKLNSSAPGPDTDLIWWQ